jgi:hypothetical protein
MTTRVNRKPYQAPRLLEYGSLRKLTREVGCNTQKDGGSNALCRRT